MDVSDVLVGKLLLILVGTIFLIFVIWVNTYPFIDKVKCDPIMTEIRISTPAIQVFVAFVTLSKVINNIFTYKTYSSPKYHELVTHNPKRFKILLVHSRPQVGSTVLWHLGFLFRRGINAILTLPHLPISLSFIVPHKQISSKQNMERRNEWVVIGISGVTCGGKTSLANRLKEKLTPAYLFHQDQYFYSDDSPHHVKCDNLEHNNYDILSALDMDRMYKDIRDTIQGDSKCDHVSLEQGDKKFKIDGKKFMIVEGFTVLNYEPIIKLCDLSYYLVLEYGECAARRCLRVYDPPDVAGYFDQCVWPEHLRYRAQIEKDPRVKILDGTAQDSLEMILVDLARLHDNNAVK